MKAVRVMLADGNDEIVAQLQKILDTEKKIQVVGLAKLGAECVRKAAVAKPHVIVMDLKFPDMGGGRVIRQLAQMGLPLAVIILSPYAVKGSPVLSAALSAGAFDYILSPTDPRRLDRIARQVITAILVAAFSKTKQIPLKEKAQPEKVEAAIQQIKALDGILIDCAGDCFRDVRSLLVRLKPKFRPALLIVLRQPADFVKDFVGDIGRECKVEVHEAADGDYLLPGHVYATGQAPEDRVVDRNVTGEWIMFKILKASRHQAAEPGPGAVLLYESFARSYGNRAAIVLLGTPTPEAVEAIGGMKRFSALTVVEERSKAALDGIKSRWPDGGVPDDILSVDQLEAIINATAKGA